MMTMTIADGIYFLSPEGSCWIAVQYRNGQVVDQTEEANAGTHSAANDDWAGVVPDETDREVCVDVASAIVAEVMGEDVHAEMVVVTKQ